MTFKIKDKISGVVHKVYAIEKELKNTMFLVHTEEYGWSWVNADYFEPLQVERTGYLDNDD